MNIRELIAELEKVAREKGDDIPVIICAHDDTIGGVCGKADEVFTDKEDCAVWITD